MIIGYPITFKVLDFINVYGGSRSQNCPTNHRNCLAIRFKVLTSKYDQTTTKIEKFMNLEKYQHVYQFKKFNPKLSVNNTQTRRRPENKRFIKDIYEIENKLNNWSYKFE